MVLPPCQVDIFPRSDVARTPKRIKTSASGSPADVFSFVAALLDLAERELLDPVLFYKFTFWSAGVVSADLTYLALFRIFVCKLHNENYFQFISKIKGDLSMSPIYMSVVFQHCPSTVACRAPISAPANSSRLNFLA